ncbi:MAG: hypothetical protein ABSC06_35945 [Rhodopila sp.]
MGDETEVPGSDVVLWLSRAAPEEATAFLVGCALDDDSGDQLAPIIGLDRERNALVVEGGRRVPMARVRDGVIVDPRPGAPLSQAILASRTPAEQQERAVRSALGRAGVDPDRLASPIDRLAVLALVGAAESGNPPTYQVRHAGYLALGAGQDSGLARVGARLFAALAARYAAVGRVPDDLHWRRAWLLRTAGQLREAVAVSDVLHASAPLDPATERSWPGRAPARCSTCSTWMATQNGCRSPKKRRLWRRLWRRGMKRAGVSIAASTPPAAGSGDRRNSAVGATRE